MNRVEEVERIIEYIENFIVMEALCDKEYSIECINYGEYFIIKLFIKTENYYKGHTDMMMRIDITRDKRLLDQEKYIYKIDNWYLSDWRRKINKFLYESRMYVDVDHCFNLYGTHNTLLKFLSYIWG